MRKRKFNYDGDEFYDEVFALAMNGATDSEIAVGLADKFGTGLSADVFGSMRNGNYVNWTKEENEKYGGRLNRVLTRAREKTNFIVRARYLKAALGGIVTKNKTTEKRHLVVNGVQTEDEVVRISETEFESAPNLQALATWLYHHDPEWRAIQQGLKEDAIPEVESGVDIGKWIEKECNDKDA